MNLLPNTKEKVFKYADDILTIFREQPFLLNKSKEIFIVNKHLTVHNYQTEHLILDKPMNSATLIENIDSLTSNLIEKDKLLALLKKAKLNKNYGNPLFHKIALITFQDDQFNTYGVLNLINNDYVLNNSLDLIKSLN